MQISQQGVELIKHFEGCRLEAYLCPAGIWTIGYGHTLDVKEGDRVDQEAAEAFLIEDLEEFEDHVQRLVEVDLSQDQFDALVSWTFNLGYGNLAASTLLARLNDGLYDEVPEQIKRWTRAGGRVLEGLVKRRNAEAALWEGRDWREAV
jgi:lysozyme